MNIQETGEVRIHERMPDPKEAPAFEIDAPVGPTVADPVTGELSEIDSADVERVDA